MSNFYLKVFTNLQPLNVCLTHEGTINIVNKLSEDHDVEVQYWCDELTSLIEKPATNVRMQTSTIITPFYV